MKQILLIIPYGGVGGMERLAISFYNHFKTKGHETKVLKFIKLPNDIINFGEDELFLSDKDYANMSKINRLNFNFTAPLRLRKLIKKYKITHSISFGEPANIYNSLTYTKEFKVGSIHALKSVELSNKSKLSKLTQWGFKNTYKRLDKLVCISYAIKKDLVEKCAYNFQENLEVIYNPHDIEKITALANEPIGIEEAHLFDENTIVYLGRLSTQKSPWHFIKAFSMVKKQNTKARLLVIGDGDPNVTAYCKELIIKLNVEDAIIFLGRKANPYKYLAKAKLLVLASHYEGTPNVIVESIAVNTPIVSSNCTKGIIELMSLTDHYDEILENTEVSSGIITPNLFKGVLGIPTSNDFLKEEQALAKAILKVLATNVFDKQIEQDREALLSKFDLEKVAKSYLTPLY